MMATLRRPHRNEAGFSLAELLITTAIIGFILAAVLGVYQVMQRSAFVGAAAEDAQVVTRLMLERIVTEFQLINAGRPTSAGGAITAASATSVTFYGDVNNDTLDAATGNPATLTLAANKNDKTVTVSAAQGFVVGKWFSVQSGTTTEPPLSITNVGGNTLTLDPASAGLSQPYPAGSIARSVEQVTYAWTNAAGGTLTRTAAGVTDTLATNVQTFQLTYQQGGAGGAPADLSTQAGRDLIRRIVVSLACLAQSGDQTAVRAMMTTVRPRNL
jgi:prepilin-type N-terminal cleavage/methylation domain-containing protein